MFSCVFPARTSLYTAFGEEVRDRVRAACAKTLVVCFLFFCSLQDTLGVCVGVLRFGCIARVCFVHVGL